MFSLSKKTPTTGMITEINHGHHPTMCNALSISFSQFEVDFEQWLAFAESMRTAMCQALPVKTIPFSDSSAPAMRALMAKPQGQECSSGSSSSKK